MKIDANVVYPYPKKMKISWIFSRYNGEARLSNVHVVLPLVTVYRSSMIEKPIMFYDQLRLTVVS